MDKNILHMSMTERFKYINEQKKHKYNGRIPDNNVTVDNSNLRDNG